MNKKTRLSNEKKLNENIFKCQSPSCIMAFHWSQNRIFLMTDSDNDDDDDDDDDDWWPWMAIWWFWASMSVALGADCMKIRICLHYHQQKVSPVNIVSGDEKVYAGICWWGGSIKQQWEDSCNTRLMGCCLNVLLGSVSVDSCYCYLPFWVK